MEHASLSRILLAVVSLSLGAGCGGAAGEEPHHAREPQIVVAQTRLYFGEGADAPVPVGATLARPIQFFNDGTNPLEVQQVELSGEGAPAFDVVPLERSRFELNEPVELVVRFSPAAPGRFLATVTLRTNAANLPRVTVALQGRAE